VRRYLATRLLQAFGVVAFVTTLTFVIVHLAPGDPVGMALQSRGITEEVRQQQRASFGFDQPVGKQYLLWLASVARGELGYSYSHRQPVRDVLATALPRTALLSGLALLLSFVIGITVGLLQAEYPRGARDRWLGRVLLVLYSVPEFWLALLVLILFAYRLPWFPAGGMYDPVLYDYMSPSAQIVDRLKHLVLPVFTLALLSTAAVARYQRGALVAVLHSDWMRTALAKGLSWRAAVRQHAFRNALLPTITLLGINLSAFAAGAIFVEKVFSWPGMGFVTIDAISKLDYPLVTAGVLVMSIIVVIGALIADIAVAIVDPRIRLS
jgi:peptide/nickel transport system permease protein